MTSGDRPSDHDPSGRSIERAGIKSVRSVGVRVALVAFGAGALVVVAVALALDDDAEVAEVEPAAPDAGRETASRPIEIGMPEIIARHPPPAPDEPSPREPRPRPVPRPTKERPPPGRPDPDGQRPDPLPDAPPDGLPGEDPREEAVRQATAAAYSASAHSAVQRSYLGQVQGCFDRAADVDPSISGSVRIGFVIGDDGRVLTSRVVRDGTGHPEVGACLASAARGWRLPPPPRNALEMQMTFGL